MHLLRHRKIPKEHDAYLEEMKMKFAKRMDRFGEGIFSRLAEIKNKRISEGKEVIDLSIGAPNIPPAEHIRKALCEEAMKPEKYVGRAKEQVEAYLTNVINPLLEKNQEVLGVKAEINV